MLSSDEGLTLFDLTRHYGYTIADFVSNYPIWDESKRDWLNARIYDHFMTREIACETGEQLVIFFSRKMCEVMPRYNPMFAAVDAGIDVLSQYGETYTAEYSNTGKNDNTGSGKSDGKDTSASTGRVLNSTTPQTQLSAHEQYADALQDSTADGTNTSTSTSTSESHTTKSDSGTSGHTLKRTGNPADQLNAWVSGATAILPLLFRELETLFNQVWS